MESNETETAKPAGASDHNRLEAVRLIMNRAIQGMGAGVDVKLLEKEVSMRVHREYNPIRVERLADLNDTISTLELAERSGVSNATICNYESGRCGKPSLLVLMLLSDALECDFGHFCRSYGYWYKAQIDETFEEYASDEDMHHELVV